MAGQMIMQGFVGFRIPLWLRRAVTLVPSFVVVALGADTTHALILSQVVLSLALPLPMAALLWFTSCEDVMGGYTNRMWVTVVATLAALVVLSFNVILVLQTFGVAIPGLAG
jgi:manganese transport protein